MKKAIIFILTALSLAGCIEYDINEVLLTHTDVSLSQRGNDLYIFNSANGQVGLNAEKTLYRYISDDLSSWLEVSCQSKPGGVGESVTADIKWKSKTSNGNEKGLVFEIKQTEGNGMIWLWNSTNNIGLIIRDFE